jgi:methionyl-tRNA formyltransferase
MKFVLLGSGKIAENFCRDKKISGIIKNKLAGAILSKNIYSFVNKSKNKKYILQISTKQQDIKNLSNIIQKTKPDFILSIQFPWILPKYILKQIAYKFANLHNSKLPKYRGHNTLSHEILNKERTHTITLHWIGKKVDSGFIIGTKKISIRPSETAFSLWEKSLKPAVNLLKGWIIKIQKQNATLDPKRGKKIKSGGRFYSKNITNYKILKINVNAEKIERFARAFYFPNFEPPFLVNNKRKVFLISSAD